MEWVDYTEAATSYDFADVLANMSAKLYEKYFSYGFADELANMSSKLYEKVFIVGCPLWPLHL